MSCEGFSCGNEELDDFFKNDCLQYEKALLSKNYCYVLDENPKIIVCAFTLSNESVRVDLLPNQRRKKILKNYPHEKRLRRYPAVLIGRLGVNSSFTNMGIGTEMMDLIKSWVFIENISACRYIAVDALNNANALSFYEKNGFSYLFSTEEQEAENMKVQMPIKTRYMYYDMIDLVRITP